MVKKFQYGGYLGTIVVKAPVVCYTAGGVGVRNTNYFSKLKPSSVALNMTIIYLLF